MKKMEEKERIISLFEKLYNGEPWIDVPIQRTLSRITARQANYRPLPNCNTIWEIVNHLIDWKATIQKRLSGINIETPANNFISPILDPSDSAWRETLQRFDKVQREWVEFLKNSDPNSYDFVYPANQMTFYEHILGVLQHDAYHLGQIVIFAKQS
jgi:uncharacterized damage-inducible protein DinB